MFEVKSNFIADFKLGDNIIYNLRILSLLYSHYEKEKVGSKELLHKPMIITLVSIAEALLADFHYRARTFTQEGLNNLPDKTLDALREKDFDEFAKLIASTQKHNLFAVKTNTLYEALDELRKLRNRIHIQNTKNHFERDEDSAFSKERLIKAEKVLEKMAKILSAKYPRTKGRHHVADFFFPWKEHFS